MKTFFSHRKVPSILALLIMLLGGHFQMSASDDLDGKADWDFETKDLRYKITSTEKMEVGVIGTKSLEFEHMEIPATVVWENKDYTVTSIMKLKYMHRVYWDQHNYNIPSESTKFTSIYIPRTVTEIAQYALNYVSEKIDVDPGNPKFTAITRI